MEAGGRGNRYGPLPDRVQKSAAYSNAPHRPNGLRRTPAVFRRSVERWCSPSQSPMAVLMVGGRFVKLERAEGSQLMATTALKVAFLSANIGPFEKNSESH